MHEKEMFPISQYSIIAYSISNLSLLFPFSEKTRCNLTDRERCKPIEADN